MSITQAELYNITNKLIERYKSLGLPVQLTRIPGDFYTGNFVIRVYQKPKTMTVEILGPLAGGHIHDGWYPENLIVTINATTPIMDDQTIEDYIKDNLISLPVNFLRRKKFYD